MTGRPGIATRLGERQAEPDRCGLAIAMILLASLSFSLVAVMVRLSGDVPLYEKVFFRGVVMVAAMAAIAVRRRENPFAVTPRVHLLLLRSAFGTAAMFLYFFAIEHLALADAAVLNNLSPFFVAIFAVVFLKERLMRYTVPVLLLAFAGAMFVVKPKFSLEVVPAIAGLLSAAGSGAAYTLVRFLRGYEPPYRIVMYFSVVSVIVALPPMLGNFVMPEGTQWIYLLGAGVFATTGQMALTIGYHHAPAVRISIYTYAQIIYAYILGLVLWREMPDVLSIAGTVLIIGAAVYNYRRALGERSA